MEGISMKHQLKNGEILQLTLIVRNTTIAIKSLGARDQKRSKQESLTVANKSCGRSRNQKSENDEVLWLKYMKRYFQTKDKSGQD